MTELTEYETSYSKGVKVFCPCEWVADEMRHSVPVSHVLAHGTCNRNGASLDGARMRLELNDSDTGKFAQEYRLDIRVERMRNGDERAYYVPLLQCPYESCDGELTVEALEGDDRGHCEACGGTIAGVDLRVGTDCTDYMYPV